MWSLGYTQVKTDEQAQIDSATAPSLPNESLDKPQAETKETLDDFTPTLNNNENPELTSSTHSEHSENATDTPNTSTNAVAITNTTSQ